MNENELINVINEIPLDLRVEVVVADILNSGFNATDLFVKPNGLFGRRFNKDINKAEVVELNNREQVVFVSTHRESLYDALPQAFFHNQPGKGSKAFKTGHEMVDEYKQRLIEEAEARKFFNAYEVEFFRQRIINEMQESKLIEAVSYSMNDSEFLSYWQLPGILDKRQKGILFYLFPVFNKIRGNTDYMQEIYKMIIRQNVEVCRNDSFIDFYFNDDPFKLGITTLAVNSIVGNKVKNYFPVFEINIGTVSNENLKDFLPEGLNIKIIKKLNSYFIPLHCDVEINILPEIQKWILNEAEKFENRLGYNMAL